MFFANQLFKSLFKNMSKLTMEKNEIMNFYGKKLTYL